MIYIVRDEKEYQKGKGNKARFVPKKGPILMAILILFVKELLW